MAPEVQVANNAEQGRYEALVGGAVAGYAAYRERPGEIVITHTEVADEWEGQGVAGRLIGGALDDIRARGLSVTPICRFTRGYIERHPEYADLVAG
jgi:predicted GNAT family acetyltransferase